MKVKTRKELRAQRHKRVRAKVKGSAVCPRLSMMISTRHMYAQLIDDDAGVTLASASSLQDGNPRVETAQALGKRLGEAARRLSHWRFIPNGTEGFAKAEVTAGGISTTELSSKNMEARQVPGFYAIGEAVDVTGWLGGYNFQWAWASGHAAGKAI